MNMFEVGMPDLGHDIRTLQDDELGIVTGGANSQLDYQGSPVVTYSIVNAWPPKYSDRAVNGR